MSTQYPTLNVEDQGVCLWKLTLDISGLRDPASTCSTASMAREIIGSHKPYRHNMAETASWDKGKFHMYFKLCACNGDTVYSLNRILMYNMCVLWSLKG